MKVFEKLLAVMLAVALPAAALAQAAAEPAPAPAPVAAPTPPPAPLAQVYGTLNVNLQYTGAEGATNTLQNVRPRFGLGLDSSNIGVRGSVDVAGGLKAIYQCETTASVDGEGVSGICNRNSRLGVSGGFGTLFYGNWDTPYKAGTYGTNAEDPFGNTDVFGYANIMGSPGYGVRSGSAGATPIATGTSAGIGTPTAAFDLRGGNSLAYWSPKYFGALSFKLQVSLDELGNATGLIRPAMYAGSLNFDSGGFSVSAQLDVHEDYYGIRTVSPTQVATDNSASGDAALRLAAGYALPLGEGSTLTLIGWLESLAYTQPNATVGFKSYGRLAYLAGAKYRMGDHEFRARYSAAMKPTIKEADGTTLAAGAEDDLGAQNIVLGYAFYLAKSTQVYGYWSQIMNEDRARYTFGVGGVAAVVGTTASPFAVAGSSPYAVGLGMRHSF